MNTALIFAGGTGQRMNSKSKPKQFLELHGKPILIHTIEHFENHPDIDYICIVCLQSWIDELYKNLKKYGISKVRWVTAGGNTGHESIYNGLKVMSEDCKDDDIVLIHDGVRPLITGELISQNIDAVKKYGNAITVEKAIESIAEFDENDMITEMPPRDFVGVAKAPQSFYFKDIWEVHKRAKEDGFLSIDPSHLMNHYGYRLHKINSTPYNIKITTPSDYYVFRALFEAKENSQIFGI